ncbi:MAG TPA: hypothetical protein VIV60_13465 [Polyangiaceae bacterium]
MIRLSFNGCHVSLGGRQACLVSVTALLALACGSDPSLTKDEDVTTTQAALHTLVGATWIPQGPAPMINGQAFTFPLSNQNPVTGAGHAVVAHPTDPNIIYFGAVNGGVWRTNDAQALRPTWTPLTDQLPSLNIGALALERNNPNVIIAGTGRWSSDANEGGSQGEVLVSRNAGTTWTVLTDPLFINQKLSGVVIRGNTLLEANISSSIGLARSSNGGTTWTAISGAAGTGLPFGTVDDLIEDRQNANRLYVTMSGVGVFRSDDLGMTWTNVSVNDAAPGGLDETVRTNSSATRMSTASDGRAYVATVTFAGVIGFVAFTTNGGATWTRMEDPGIGARGNPFFHFAIGADPVDSRFVYLSGISDWVRGDASIPPGSGQWTPTANAGTPNFTVPHADARDIAFNANNDMIEVSDGGIFRRPTPQVSADWVSQAGSLQTAEIHDAAYDANSRIIFGGTQDNGTIFQTVPSSLAWDTFQGGDGGDVQVDVLSNPGFSIRYASFQFLGGFSRTTYNAANQEISRVFPALAGGAISPQFYTPIELNRVNPLRIVIGASDAVYESFDQAENITSLGNAGGARSMFYGHPGNVDALYVVREVIFVRLSPGGTLAPTPTPIPTTDARDVVLDPSNFRRAYVAGGASGVFLTPDAGVTWNDITGNLVTFDTGLVRTIEFVPGPAHGLVVVGTNRGVFATATDALGTWQEVGNLPNAPAFDMQYTVNQDLLMVTLMGRGAWTVSGLGANQPPIARCRDVAIDAGPSCTAAVSANAINNGSVDPEGSPVNCVLNPVGPFTVGTTTVTLTCTDNAGATASCSASVHVGPGDTAACCPVGTNVILGTASNDTINGTANADCILGRGGQDRINGQGGDDLISAGDGDDIVSGGSGNDRIFGGTGQDNLGGNDGNDLIAGGEGDDQCFGGAGDDSILGGGGQDRLFGEAGNDRLTGNDGDDRLEGGDGDDFLDGSGLHDICVGGPGVDTFLVCQSQTQ